MNIAVISDIHGNQVALNAVLEHIAHLPMKIDALVVAGDLCLNGPQPREVLETLQSLHCPVIQGNVDVDVIQQRPKKGTRKRDIVDWTREQIGEKGIHYLDNLPLSHCIKNPNGTDLLVVHANPLDQDNAIFPTTTDKDLEHLLGKIPTSVGALAFGHVHIAYQRMWHNLLLLDVGSCGLPRDEDHRASYGVLMWHGGAWHAEHHRVPYNISEVANQLRNCGMPHAEKRVKVLLEARYS